ncbi:hypothetical protein EDC01DRAFT_212288 [Geopyxis carbonaria]|nr:hypothetical protein EDC01DRAFT_212288 [Geopyxis carbonaria]
MWIINPAPRLPAIATVYKTPGARLLHLNYIPSIYPHPYNSNGTQDLHVRDLPPRNSLASKVLTSPSTGATGFIGGTALNLLVTTHPEYEITALVRDDAKAAALKAKFPSVKTVLGDLDSSAVIEAASAASDIVLNTANCDHVASAESIIAGLSSRSTPTHLIHTSGTGILPDLQHPENLGEAIPDSERYSDIADLHTLTSWDPAGHIHRDVDTVVLAAPASVNTAIVCPPMIYGAGTGSGNTKSMQVPWLIAAILRAGHGFKVGRGLNRWNSVHVRDLAKVYLALTEAAVAGGAGADWNADGYYFAENGEFCWGELAQEITKRAAARGLVESDGCVGLTVQELKKHHDFGGLLWGSNSIGKAERARKVLGWTPSEKALLDELDAAIEIEAKAQGKA